MLPSASAPTNQVRPEARAPIPNTMALSQTAEYALRAVVWLAQNPGYPQTTHQLSEATQVPMSYLPKVFQPLVRSGIISGQRGLGGGYALVKDPRDLTMLEVVNCVDPIVRIESCPLDIKSHGVRLCPLHSTLNQAIIAEEKRLAQTRIGDLIGRPGQLQPLCEVADRMRDERTKDDAPTSSAPRGAG